MLAHTYTHACTHSRVLLYIMQSMKDAPLPSSLHWGVSGDFLIRNACIVPKGCVNKTKDLLYLCVRGRMCALRARVLPKLFACYVVYYPLFPILKQLRALGVG